MKVLFLVISLVAVVTTKALPPDQLEFFESRIRPVLIQECYECHSSNGKAKSGLALDHRTGLLEGGDGGSVVVPFKPEESLLIRAIRHDDEDLAMPKSGEPLDDRIINDFIEWIRMGAPDPRDSPPSGSELEGKKDWESVMEERKSWWSFQPIKNAKPPEIAGASHPIDRFVDRGIVKAGLTPAAQAEAPVLVRRIYFAITGLPPSPDQVRSFLQAHRNNSVAAIEALIDDLLARPEFGERWARHWMDWIRYAESHGSEGDPSIQNAHLYRDYLIRALNEDIPYDQLLREHVAGDLLDDPRLNQELGINESIVGTAHWRMVFHGFAPTDALDEKVRFTDDQISVFSKAFLGLTVSCARCHNHKFDAISQEDYYALFGILGSTRPGRTAIDLPSRLNRNRDKLEQLKPKILDALALDWLAQMPSLKETLSDTNGPSKDGQKPRHLLHPLFAVDKVGKEPESFHKTWVNLVESWKVDLKEWREHESRPYRRRWDLGSMTDRQEWFSEGIGLSEGSVTAGGFSVEPEGDNALIGIYPKGTFTHLLSTKHGGRLTSPDFHLDGEYDLWLRITGGGKSMSRYVVQNYPRDGTVYPVTQLGDDKVGEWRWQRYDVAYWNADEIHIELATANDAPLLVKNSPRSWFGISEAVLVPKDKGGPHPPEDPREHLGPIFKSAESTPPGSREHLVDIYIQSITDAIKEWAAGTIDVQQAHLLNACLRLGLLPNKLELLAKASELIREYRRFESEIPVPIRVPTIAEWTAKDQPLYERGNHKRPLKPVSRRFIEAIDKSPYQTRLSGRRELAEDLLREDNPFTRRVIVNRIWHHLFGRGIVETPDNFGRLGSEPSHPELLDYLAVRFVEHDKWSIKRLIRHILTSRAWQRSSEALAEVQAVDPGNKLISHFNLQRLDAEAIRDALLQVSGRLDHTRFGKPVRGNAPRRSIYVNVRRNRLDPFLSTFDAPVPFSSQGRRNITTVPSQSLTMMNSPFVVEAARHWAAQFGKTEPSQWSADLLQTAWEAAFARKPTSEELQITQEFLNSQHVTYSNLKRQVAEKQNQHRTVTAQIELLASAARERIETERSDKSNGALTSSLKPVAEWLFDEDGKDSVGNLDCDLLGGARIEDGALVVSGGSSYARSAPINMNLKEKTLEAWVQLDDLEQRGGGVVSVQTRDGNRFDAIVFGEMEPGHWLAGSDNFRRTKSFRGLKEKRADKEPVHITLVYKADGEIQGYRNGKLYGNSYESSGPLQFKAGKSEVVFGLRHGKSGGDRMLLGKILEARLYDRALTQEEVAAAAKADVNFISENDLIAAIPKNGQQDWIRLNQEKAEVEFELQRLEATTPQNIRSAVWGDLALAIFNMKEFVYVR